MPVMIAAGITAGASLLGAGVSAFGASKQADAMKAAENRFKKQSNKFAKEAQAKTAALEQEKLYDLGNLDLLLEQYGGAAFGKDTTTLADLRSATQDFAALAAGNTAPFEAELRTQMQSTLANLGGSPIGTFANIAAQDRLAFRQQGLQAATSTAGFMNQLGMGLAQAKFGVLDQSYNNWANVEQFRIGAVAQAERAAAQQVGIPYAALGGAISQAAQTGLSAYMGMKQLDIANTTATNMGRYQGMMGISSLINAAANYKNATGTSLPASYQNPPVVTQGTQNNIPFIDTALPTASYSSYNDLPETYSSSYYIGSTTPYTPIGRGIAGLGGIGNYFNNVGTALGQDIGATQPYGWNNPTGFITYNPNALTSFDYIPNSGTGYLGGNPGDVSSYGPGVLPPIRY